MSQKDRTTIKLRREDLLLSACAHTRLNEGRALRVRNLVHAGINWSHFCALAERNRVVPLVRRTLNHVCPELIPTETRKHLDEITQVWGWQMTQLTGELLHLLPLFAQHTIPVIPFKGPALSIQVYGGLGLRPFGDLDLLVRNNDLAQARTLLCAQGYTPLPETPHYLLPIHSIAEYKYTFVSPNRQTRVALQPTVIQQPFPFPPEDEAERWWQEAQTVLFAGQLVACLSVEQQMLLLCVHSSNYMWERLIWVCDIAELVRSHPQLDWARLIEHARRLRVERMLYLGLLLAGLLLEAPLPSWISRLVQHDQRVVDLAFQACRFLFDTQEQEQSSQRLQQRDQFLLQAMGHWPNQLGAYLRYATRLFQPTRIYRKYGSAPLRVLAGG